MFSTDKAEGAVLLTVPPVVHERYYYESPFKKWMKTNAAAILKRRPEVKEYGLWIITSTYATKACAINMWKEGGYRVEIGFLAKAVGIGELGPSGEWMKDARLEGWSEYEFAKVLIASDFVYKPNKFRARTCMSFSSLASSSSSSGTRLV